MTRTVTRNKIVSSPKRIWFELNWMLKVYPLPHIMKKHWCHKLCTDICGLGGQKFELQISWIIFYGSNSIQDWKDTGWPRSYRKYILQITQPSQYVYAKLQYRFAVTSGSPSIFNTNKTFRNNIGNNYMAFLFGKR